MMLLLLLLLLLMMMMMMMMMMFLYNGHTPLHVACHEGHDNVVEMLLKHGVDAEAKGKGGYTPMHRACGSGHVKVVEMLLKHGADTEAKNNVSTVPLPPSSPLYPPMMVHLYPMMMLMMMMLYLACGSGHVKVVEMLLKHGADTEAKNNVSTVPPSSSLYPSMMVHLYHMMMMLMLMLYLYRGYTPLHWACHYGHVKVVEMLLKHGADNATKNIMGARPLDLLLRRHPIKLEVVTELLGATQTLCSYQTSNSDVQSLIHAEQVKCWRVGWREDPRSFNIQDLQTLGDRVAALTAAAQAAPTN
ncbi:uncharacterized protein MONBRDRAFT_28916 [Monosiga brevicollis MX1]|uniref:Uncharacterized protein n=1 Tax=Monosiga brevicollis TaxID=81824 RepID=A9V9K3_MONBE|nr:uncharacterized protein MONBRDRAFT_28916 [Monosiga brevicollis MX1]EDQ85735.1 predicted protein [Monosiga brevicollis MX1]|eukprot:XP_001749450.1 hypothetical protein [Monosiga brevicollis MX1]